MNGDKITFGKGKAPALSFMAIVAAIGANVLMCAIVDLSAGI